MVNAKPVRVWERRDAPPALSLQDALTVVNGSPTAPCWCGSGRPYCECHRGRGRLPRPTPSSIQEKVRKAKEGGQCLHGSATRCGARAISSHLMSRSAFLAPIAEGGHILERQRHLLHSAEFRKVGVNKASVFPGFCSQHDNALFRVVDNPSADLDRDFAQRLCYRAWAKELHAKQATIAIADVLHDGDAGLPLEHQVQHQDRMNMFLHATQLGVQDLALRKRWLLTGIPPVVGTGAYSCEAMFTGEYVAFGPLDDVIPVLAHALVPFRGGGLSLFGWFCDGMEGQYRRFAESIECLLPERMPTALARFTIDVSENFFMRLSWYQGLDAVALADIRDRMACGLHEPHSGLCLLDSPAVTIPGRGGPVYRSWT